MVAQFETLGLGSACRDLRDLLYLLKGLKRGMMESAKDVRQKRERDEKAYAAQVNRALGIFLLFFGLIVMASFLMTETPIGKAVNLLAGGIITLIGGLLFAKGRSAGPGSGMHR